MFIYFNSTMKMSNPLFMYVHLNNYIDNFHVRKIFVRSFFVQFHYEYFNMLFLYVDFVSCNRCAKRIVLVICFTFDLHLQSHWTHWKILLCTDNLTANVIYRTLLKMTRLWLTHKTSELHKINFKFTWTIFLKISN